MATLDSEAALYAELKWETAGCFDEVLGVTLGTARRPNLGREATAIFSGYEVMGNICTVAEAGERGGGGVRGSPRLQRIGRRFANEFVREAPLNSLLSWRRDR